MKHLYTYQVLEGDSRNIGRQQARLLMESKPNSVHLFETPFNENPGRLKEAEAIFKMNEIWCPGINEEISGFAEELGVKPEAAVYYTETIPRTCNCSQFAILPDHTENGTTLCARSYEWSTEDEMTLQTIRIPGKAAHTGFSVCSAGRFDGLNEYGLWVSMTAGNPGPNLPSTPGFRFWALIRTILDRCHTVEEAIEITSSFPLAFHLILLVAEKTGKAALIEKSPDQQIVRRIETGFIHSTNHYTLAGMHRYNREIFDHSQKRYDFIKTALGKEKQSPETVRKILASSFPEGLSCHYFTEGLGTLWSMYADLTDGTLQVCFGPPDINGNTFRTFSPHDRTGVAHYEIELPDENASDDTWLRIPNPER